MPDPQSQRTSYRTRSLGPKELDVGSMGDRAKLQQSTLSLSQGLRGTQAAEGDGWGLREQSLGPVAGRESISCPGGQTGS